MEAVVAALEAKHMERARDADPCREAFLARVWGGRWTAKNMGLVADAMRAYSSTNEARERCELYGVQTTARVNFAWHDEAARACLAHYWASSMGIV